MLGCRRVIRGVTGLDELMKLRKHLLDAHGWAPTMNQALEIRILFEQENGGSWTVEELGTVVWSLLRDADDTPMDLSAEERARVAIRHPGGFPRGTRRP